jgi:peptidyl-prolyl cis-trans isomerase D
MSVIQQIQEKYAKLMAVILAVALIMFVVMLAFENGGSLFNNQSTTVGKINGEAVDYTEFQLKVKQAEEMIQRQQQGYGPTGAALTAQAVEQAWSMEIDEALMKTEFEKLGMSVGKKELNDILFGTNPPDQFKQAFTDSLGNYNPILAQQRLNEMKKSGTPEEKAGLNDYLDQLAAMRLREKYNSLLANTSNAPKWLLEKQNADNSQIANISFVRETYASIPDSAVKVTDKEIESYISKHKEQYKQAESRSIAFVPFSAIPSAADSAEVKQSVQNLATEFAKATDNEEFLMGHGINNYYNGYISGKRIQIPNKDSIFKTPVGQLYGPYLDGTNWAYAKMVGVRTIPDTVKVRHILVGTRQQDPQTGQAYQIRDDETAYKLADSLSKAIAKGSSFDTLLPQFSTDLGSVSKGGVYEDVPSGQMVGPFNDYIFTNPVGTKGIVKTEFGTHYVEILSSKGSGPAYNVAYLFKPIEASNETTNAASNEATKFAANSRNKKSLDENADKLFKEKGINKSVATNITPGSVDIMGLGQSREFVKAINAADLGDVLPPTRVGENYVVAIVTEVLKEGTKSAATARLEVQPLLINEKKAEVIKNKIGNITTLEAAAATLGKTVEVADSIRFSGASSTVLGMELKVIGATFNKANANKVINQPINGAQGVYVVQVNSVAATPTDNANIAQLRSQRYMQAKQQAMYMQPTQALREAATIKDNRAKFF